MQRLGAIEAADQGETRATEDGAIHPNRLPKRVEQRQAAHQDIVGGEFEPVVGDYVGIAAQIGVGEFCPLRLARGAGRVQDDGRVVVRPVDDRRRIVRTRCRRLEHDELGP